MASSRGPKPGRGNDSSQGKSVGGKHGGRVASQAHSKPSGGPPVVRAHVGLRGPGGKSVYDVASAPAQISAQNIAQFVAEPAARDRARAWLEQNGFSVEHVSPLSIMVEAPADRFETVFRGRLKPLPAPAPQPAEPHALQSGGDYWDWEHPPAIPPEVSDVISSVTLPQPAKPLT